MAQLYLSKSKYLIGLQCHKLLWTHHNAKEKLPPVDEETQAVFDQGQAVGLLAQKLFPKGIAVSSELSIDDATAQSRRLLEERKPLFEAAFAFRGTFARVDVLDPVRGGKWDVVEVKSSTEIKDPNWDDVAFQRYCYEGAGVQIGRCRLMHINNAYVRHGEIDPSLLFAKDDISATVREKSLGIEDRIRGMLDAIESKKCPEIEIGPHCDTPYECPLKYLCWEEVNKVEKNVFTLPRIGPKAWQLYKKGFVRNDRVPADFPLSKIQKIQIEAERTNTPHVERSAVVEFLDNLIYPLYLLDFETFQTAIPLIDGTSPYKQVPFQFSLHVAESLDPEPSRHSWLWDGAGDPRESILKRLLPLLGKKGSIVAYNASFEKSRLRECAEAYPRFSTSVDAVLDRIIDLYAPFRSFSVYYPAQHGSASIKQVLPALTGGAYGGLSIQNGGQASKEFKRIMFGEADQNEREKVRRDLEAYCGMDTMSMLEIIKTLKRLIDGK
jgi:hypothetical protein